MKSKGIVYLGNKKRFVPIDQAVIPVTDRIVTRGMGVFEYLRTYNMVPFELEAHLKRLRKSLKIAELEKYIDLRDVRKKIFQGLKRFRKDVDIRVIVTGGTSSYLGRQGKPILLIYFLPQIQTSRKKIVQGIQLKTEVFTRHLPETKFTDYFLACILYQQATKNNFEDVLYRDSQGNILEGTTYNFAIRKGRNFITPKSGVLPGVTISAAMKFAKNSGMKVVRRKIKLTELRTAQEAWAFSTTKEVLPVVRVDRIRIGNGHPGKFAKLLLDRFLKYVDTKTKNAKENSKIS